MSRKHSLPNVDEEALAALARQFPSMNARAENRDERSVDPPANGAQAAAEALQPAPERSFAADRAPMASVKPPAIAEQRTRRRGGGRLLALLAVLIALGALAVALGPAAPPQLRAGLAAWIDEPAVVDVLTGNRRQLDARLAAIADGMKALTDRQAQIAARLEAIEAVGGSSDGAARRVAAVENGLKAVEARIAAIEEYGKTADGQIGKLGERADAADTVLKANAERLSAIEDGVTKAGTAIAALVKSGGADKLFLTALQLRGATQLSGPFAAELAAVRAAATDGNAETQAALRALAAHAQIGVPTMPELRDSFSMYVAPRVVALSPAGQRGLTDRTKAWVQSVFSPRTVDETVGGDRNATIIALAERSLAKGQLAAAVDQIALLEDQAALIATEWLKGASARLTTDKASATLMAQAFDRLASTN
jgi:uroporphyrinogen-III synthase